jgi:hypothetical protein
MLMYGAKDEKGVKYNMVFKRYERDEYIMI